MPSIFTKNEPTDIINQAPYNITLIFKEIFSNKIISKHTLNKYSSLNLSLVAQHKGVGKLEILKEGTKVWEGIIPMQITEPIYIECEANDMDKVYLKHREQKLVNVFEYKKTYASSTLLLILGIFLVFLIALLLYYFS